ncbi:hypothetical protein [Sphingomonas sp. MMS24-J13]|uniref:hypothetical protein n=1 Tax=Sphingomonas sp. MMS24-J13 TaxID=3238686 RepID=UPI00384FE709
MESKIIALGTMTAPSYYYFSSLVDAEIMVDHGLKGSDNSFTIGSGDYRIGTIRAQETIKALTLKVTVQDTANPVYRIRFFQAFGAGADPTSKSVDRALHDIERVHANLLSIVRMKVPVPTAEEQIAISNTISAPVSAPVEIPFNHWPHIVISVLTSGMWLPFYAFFYTFRRRYDFGDD